MPGFRRAAVAVLACIALPAACKRQPERGADAVEKGMGLAPGALAEARDVLARYGNMSSSTLMFVLAALLERPDANKGLALAFGPGLAAEGFRFSRAGR